MWRFITGFRIQDLSSEDGDMFQEIPKADAVFMKWIMHDWSDEDCIRILKQCKKAIPESTKFIYSQEEVILNFYFHYLFMNMSET